MRAMGHDPSEQDVQSMLKKVDKDGNVAIEFPEFLRLVQQWRPVRPRRTSIWSDSVQCRILQQGLQRQKLEGRMSGQPARHTRPWHLACNGLCAEA
jgi:hypothetical protein